jgi:hypothetical protein
MPKSERKAPRSKSQKPNLSAVADKIRMQGEIAI